MTSYHSTLGLVIHSDYDPIAYRFQDKLAIFAKFSHPLVFNAPAEEVPLGIL